MEFEELLYDKVKTTLLKWNKTGVYAVYFGVIPEPANGNIPRIVIGCGIEGHAENITGKWHLAVCPSYETDLTKDKKTAKAMKEWLHSQGVENIGADDNGAPAGCRELVSLGADIAKRLFSEGVIKEHFGEDIPFVFDDMDSSDYCIEATKAANPKGLADECVKSLSKSKKLGQAGEGNSPKGIFRLVEYFPNSLFMMLVTLIGGGIAFPLTTGGIVKLVLLGISIISDVQKKLQTKPSPMGKTIGIMLADLLMACAIVFSKMIIPDRLLALAAFVFVIIFSLADGKLTGDSVKNLRK